MPDGYRIYLMSGMRMQEEEARDRGREMQERIRVRGENLMGRRRYGSRY